MSDPKDPAVDEEAMEWLVRLQFGTANRTDFTAWRARSPAHETAARAAETLWREIGQTDTAVAFARRESARRAGPDPRVARLPSRAARPAFARRAVLTGAVAASAALVVGGSGVFGPLAALTADYATRPGERRAVSLPDGSTVLLNTATALSVTFTPEERRVSLEAGEAFFEVAKDPDRPFIVTAKGGETRAVGTAFAVRTDGDLVRVTVTEGIVEVTARSAAPVSLVAGQGTSYGPKATMTSAYYVNEAVATAWRRGKLIFNQRPLEEVAAEMSRYSAGRIVVTNEELKRLPVTGVFELDDPDGMLRAIEQILPVKVMRLPLLTLLR